MNIGIVGLGLIGGSFAKSIKSKTSHTVYGIDLDKETMTLARLCGAIDGTLSDDTIKDCDLILIALRPNAAGKWLCENAPKIAGETIVTDMCGVKRTVCEEFSKIAEKYGFLYIGGHPMAGKERGGFVNSSENLFEGASMILTPDEKTDIVMLEKLKTFYTDLGFGTLTFTTPDEHDRIIAYTSQLAHIASSAYIKSPEALRRRGFSAGSFKDMTRVSRMDEKMWTELCMTNSDYLIDQLEILINNLGGYLDALKSSDSEKLCALFKEGKDMKASAGGN